jgi:branched-chain amino acid transport system permease protein
MIERIIIYGAITSAIYCLLALGFTLIYGVARVVNLAHGALFMLGAYLYFDLGPYGLHLKLLDPLSAVILATILTGIAGIILYRLTIHPILGDEVATLIVTVAIAMILQQLMLITYGPEFRIVPPLAEGLITIFGVGVTYSSLVALFVSIVSLLVTWIFILKSKIGGALRALSQDREVAMLMGINTTKLFMLTMFISACLAALAGIFVSASTTGSTSVYMWLHPLALSFAIVVLGGLGSIKGTVLGAFIIGYAETAVAVLVPEGGAIVAVVPFTILILILLVRPKGIFGKRIEMEE